VWVGVCISRHGAHSELVRVSQDFVIGKGLRAHPPTLRNISDEKKIHKIQLKAKFFIKNIKVTCEYFTRFRY
jgi:formylglycine-generating enzyme required for sulfatase activity